MLGYPIKSMQNNIVSMQNDNVILFEISIFEYDGTASWKFKWSAVCVVIGKLLISFNAELVHILLFPFFLSN